MLGTGIIHTCSHRSLVRNEDTFFANIKLLWDAKHKLH